MNAHSMLRRLPVALGACVLFAGMPAARADLAVSLTIEKPTYLLYESLVVQVTVANHTGRTVLVGMGPQATHRLDFMIARPDGTAAGRTAAGRPPPPVQIPHGHESDIEIDLVRFYRLRSPGMYRISASVAAGPDSKVRTPPTLVEIVEGRTLWARTVGIPVPEDSDETPETRTYEILLNRIGSYDQIFLRIRDENRKLVHGVHPLGTYVPLRRPETEFDRDGVAHVLHQIAPRSYAHTAFRPDGTRVIRDHYSDLMSRPRLWLSPEGDVSVVGGEPAGVRALRPSAAAPFPGNGEPVP